MENKIYILVIAPKLETQFDILIPTNKKISFIKNKIIEGIFDNTTNIDKNIKLYDKKSGKEYDENLFLKQTNIRNGTSIILL